MVCFTSICSTMSSWRSTETLPVIIAGHPLIAKAYLRWLFNIEQRFPNIEVELEHYYMNGRCTKINLSECFLWLTEKVNKEEMERCSLVDDVVTDLWEFAESTDDALDLLDKETWGEYRFDRAYDLIWNNIASRAAQQQQVENLLQTAGHLGKMHVEEARRSARAKIHCIFYRDFNTWALQIVLQEDETKLLRAIQTNQQTQ